MSAATAYPNPVGDGTVISFSNSREAYVRIEVLDVLGNIVPTSSFESVVEAGTHQVPIVLHNLPRGNYFARIVTTYGEILTVKLVKE